MFFHYRKTTEEMMEDTRDKCIIDLRKKREYHMGTCPGAVHIYWEEFAQHIKELPMDKPIYLMCYTGVTSDEFAEDLQKKGYEAYSLEGGYRGYYLWSIMNEG